MLDSERSEVNNFKGRNDKIRYKTTGKKSDKDIVCKPTQVEHIIVSHSKEHMRNSRWTNYHSNFIKRNENPVIEKLETKSSINETKQTSKEIETAKSFIVQRMQNRGNCSPIKDQFRSTGFTYSKDKN